MSKLKVIEKLESEKYKFIRYETNDKYSFRAININGDYDYLSISDNYYYIYDKKTKSFNNFDYRIRIIETDTGINYEIGISKDIEQSYEKYIELCNEFSVAILSSNKKNEYCIIENKLLTEEEFYK